MKEAIKMTEHYYSEKQTSVFKPKKVNIWLKGTEFDMYTAGGVFSPKKVDAGTKLIIEKAIVKNGWKVLDFGCGYGVLGIALKRKRPLIDMVMSDINLRAIKLTKMNLRLHNIDAEVIQSDIFSNKKLVSIKFNTIILNPPQTAGKKVCFRMIEESKTHLLDGGLLQIVARTKKGGKHLSEHMENVFGNVREEAKGSGYRVYISEKK